MKQLSKSGSSQVLETIKRVGQIPNIATLMKPPIPCPTQYRYRNKVTFTIASDPEWLVSRNKKALLQQPIVGKLIILPDLNCLILSFTREGFLQPHIF